MQFTNTRSNRHIFVPQDSGSPKNGLFAHVSGLGPIARLDFERYDVAGEVIFKVEGDAFPTSQEDEEARIGSLAYTTASKLQRERLERARPSNKAHALFKEIARASDAKLRYLAWAMYGSNQPEHPVHKLSSQDRAKIWRALKSRHVSTGAVRA